MTIPEDMTPSARLMAEREKPLPKPTPKPSTIKPLTDPSQADGRDQPMAQEIDELMTLNPEDQVRSIVTLCLNPCLDLAVDVNELTVGALNRYQHMRAMPGGKGFNVARHLSHRKWENSIFLTLPEISRDIHHVFDETAFGACTYKVPGELRVNIKIHQRMMDGTTQMTEVNGPGDPIDEETANELRQILRHTVENSNVSVLSGSLLPGISSRIYAELLSVIKGAKGISVLDASGDQLIHAIATQAVDLFKPNRDELRALTGLPCQTHDEALDAALAICRADQAKLVLCSLGADGAILTNGRQHYKAKAPSTTDIYNLMGAGDVMTAVLAMFAAQCPLDTPIYDFVHAVPLGLLMREAMATAQALVHRSENEPPSLAEIKAYMRDVVVKEVIRS